MVRAGESYNKIRGEMSSPLPELRYKEEYARQKLRANGIDNTRKKDALYVLPKDYDRALWLVGKRGPCICKKCQGVR